MNRSIQKRLLAMALALLAGAIVMASWSGHEVFVSWLGDSAALALGVVVMLAGASSLLVVNSFETQQSNAWMRLDWFLPMLRRAKSGEMEQSWPWMKAARARLPKEWLSNRQTKRRGKLRVALRKLGVSWMASPVRRLVQGACLALFVILFLYVCWPYDARPAESAQASGGWWFDSLDQSSGAFVMVQRNDVQDVFTELAESGQSVFVNARGQSEGGLSIEMQVATRDNRTIGLTPLGEISADQMDVFLNASTEFEIYQRDPNAWPSHYADNLQEKEFIPAESFLVIDPLVSLSTAIAARSWVWSLVCAAAILIVCVLIPRGFCGYLCPLGTTIDLFDWAIAGRVKRFRVPDDGWWVHIKYYLLTATLVASLGGVLVSGFVSAIPVITRAMLFLVDPLQTGTVRGWHLLPGFHAGHFVSIGLFAGVLSLGFLRPRFWCKYVCPSGAVFSLGNLFRITERKVESSCINCNKCVEICPFDAIKPDFTTRTSDCTMCQSCGGVCPTHAIKFVERWNVVELKVVNDPPTNETALGRRGFLSAAAGTAAATVGGASIVGATKVFGANLKDPDSFRPVRPPGSVPEQEFLEMCIRCGECFKACPNNVLQPEGFEQGLEGLWSPMVNADWAGCESSCNACGQVCPTGAIRALPIAEKRVTRMGLAVVNESTCLPVAGREACDLCVQECDAAGYHAIESRQVGVEIDSEGLPIPGTGFLAPVVMEDLCVGCGLCQTRCYNINVKEKGLLSHSAIIVEAGDGKEDRLMPGETLDRLRSETPQSGERVQSGEEVRLEPSLGPLSEPPSESTSEIAPESSLEDLPSESTDDPFGIGGF